MSSAAKVLKYQLQDVARSRWIMGYALLLFLVTEALFRFGGGGERVVLSLMNVVLIFVPLVSLVFGTLYLYNAREFTELLLAQPVSRRALFAGLYGGLALPLVAGFGVGVGIPWLLNGAGGEDAGSAGPALFLLGVGLLLTLAFTALAFLVAVRFEDRARGLGAALLIWLLSTVVYDGLVLLVVALFGDYPLETPLLVLTLLNPSDLGRVLLLLNLDVAALMGYTGAVFSRFFGGSLGIAVSAGALLLWVALPLALALRRFRRKDF